MQSSRLRSGKQMHSNESHQPQRVTFLIQLFIRKKKCHNEKNKIPFIFLPATFIPRRNTFQLPSLPLLCCLFSATGTEENLPGQRHLELVGEMGGCEVAILNSCPDLVLPWLCLICGQNCRLLTSLPSQWEESRPCPASQAPSSQGWCIPGWAVGRTVSQMADGFFCLLYESFQNLILVKTLRQRGEEVMGTPGSTVCWPLTLSQERNWGPLNPVFRHHHEW